MKPQLSRSLLLVSTTAALSLAAARPTALGQQSSAEPFVTWARQRAIRIATVEPGRRSNDLRPLKALIGQARVVALGENTHGVHEFLAFRNRLFQFLVQEMDFTAIAVETGVSEATEVDAYVTGGVGDSTALARNVFYTVRQARHENRELIEWMRTYNSRPSIPRKIRFYGIDLTGQVNGQFIEARRALDAALAYIDRADVTLGQQFRQRLDPFFSRFNERDYPSFAAAERSALTAAIADLVNVFERRRLDFLAVTPEFDYQTAYHDAIAAEQLDANFRARPAPAAGKQPDFREAAMVRDAAMADNVRWALEREGPGGRVLVFAHNAHVKKSPTLKGNPQFFPGRPPTGMGEYLRSILGNDMVVFGSTFRQGEESLRMPSIDFSSIEGALARVGSPLFVIDLRAAPRQSPAAAWLNGVTRIRSNNAHDELSPAAAFDALVFIDSVTSVHPLP